MSRIKQQHVTGWESARRALRDAMRLEGLSKRACRAMDINGAMPGDGIVLGSVTFPSASTGGGQHAVMRFYSWSDLRAALNEQPARTLLAARFRGYGA